MMWKRLRRLFGFKSDGHEYRILTFNEQGASGMVLFDRALTQTEREALKQAWLETYRGWPE